MKQKDIALFAVIAVISGVMSVLVSGMVFTSQKDKVQKAEVVDTISATFVTPSSNDKFFNASSINPTKLIQIGDNANDKLFNAAGQ